MRGSLKVNFMAIARTASAQVASTISQYAQRSNVSLDDIRQNPETHRGNLRAELMQSTGDTQTFSTSVVDQLMHGLSGSSDISSIYALVNNVIDAQETRRQQVQGSMGNTLAASRGHQTQNTQSSPLMTQVGAMLGNQTPSPTRGATPSTTGAEAGMQAASIGRRFSKWVKGGAIALVVGAAVATGVMSTQMHNFSPEMPERPAIELIQEQNKEAQHQSQVGNTPSAIQVDVGAGTMDPVKEQAHQQATEGADSEVQQRNIRDRAGSLDRSSSPNVQLNDLNTIHVDKDAAHDAQLNTPQK